MVPFPNKRWVDKMFAHHYLSFPLVDLYWTVSRTSFDVSLRLSRVSLISVAINRIRLNISPPPPTNRAYIVED